MHTPISEPVEQVDRPRRGLRVRPRSRGNYTQYSNIVYGESAGIGLVMDVFQPAKGNGVAIVDVISGAWHADRARLNEHIGLGAIDAFCDAGFTVFAVAPGSATHFSAQEMVQHIHGAIRHIRSEASHWHVDETALGLCGVSAGAHLAALVALAPQPADPGARQGWFHHDTSVSAVGLFFPPTDFLDYGGKPFQFTRDEGKSLPRLLFSDGMHGRSTEAVEAAARAISPFHQIKGEHPPFFLTHATEDAVVPYSQSTRFVEKLVQAGVEAQLQTHEGGGHPWRTISEECEQMAAWFTERLRP